MTLDVYLLHGLPPDPASFPFRGWQRLGVILYREPKVLERLNETNHHKRCLVVRELNEAGGHKKSISNKVLACSVREFCAPVDLDKSLAPH